MARDIQLINCSGVTVHGDVDRFIGMGLNSLVIDNTYSDSILTGMDVPEDITADTDITRAYHGKELYVDCSGGDVTLTWDIYNQNYLSVIVIRIDSSVNNLYFDSTSTYGTESFIGNAFPYNTGMAQYECIPTRVKSDTLYINR
jgi:hypothetical protein